MVMYAEILQYMFAKNKNDLWKPVQFTLLDFT